MWIRVSSKYVWTKGTHSLWRSMLPWSLAAFHPSSPSIKHQHALPISLILPSSFLLFTDFLDIYSLSSSFAIPPFLIYPCITLHLCISSSCSAPTQSHCHSIFLHVHTPFHDSLSRLLISISLSILFHSLVNLPLLHSPWYPQDLANWMSIFHLSAHKPDNRTLD